MKSIVAASSIKDEVADYMNYKKKYGALDVVAFEKRVRVEACKKMAENLLSVDITINDYGDGLYVARTHERK